MRILLHFYVVQFGTITEQFYSELELGYLDDSASCKLGNATVKLQLR